MAKRKKIKLSRSGLTAMDRKFYGLEKEVPTDREQTPGERCDSLNWYNAMCDVSDGRKWLTDYLVGHDKADWAKKLKKVPDNSFPRTAGWLARIAMQGGRLSLTSIGFIAHHVQNAFRFISTEETEIKKILPKKDNIQDRLNEKSSDMIGEIEGLIDDGCVEGLYELLKSVNYPPMLAKRIAVHFKPQLAEAIEAIAGTDPQIKEGYRHLRGKALASHVKMLEGFISDAERYADAQKKARAPRRKKEIPTEKKVKGFKHSKLDNEFKIASIPATKLIGTQVVWLFNTKNRVLTQLVAEEKGDIQCKGNKLYGFDEKLSVSKKLRDKMTTSTLDLVLKGSKVARQKIMPTLTTKPTGLQFRGNETTILLRVEL
jgi:hypothetical protein